MSFVRRLDLISFFIVFTSLQLGVNGCSQLNQIGEPPPKVRAEEKAAQMEPMLTASGFAMLPADTPERQQQIANLPPLEVSYYVGRTGKMHYWMADPEFCKCLYIGSEQAYDRYEQMSLNAKWEEKENQTAREDLEATQEEQMDEQMEMLNPYGWSFMPGFNMY